MSDIKKQEITYLICAVLCIIINYVYHIFSHDVSSVFMTYMFIIPIIGGLFNLISNNYLYKNLIEISTVLLTLAALLKGIVDIAGATTYFTYIFLIAGLTVLIISFLFILKK